MIISFLVEVANSFQYTMEVSYCIFRYFSLQNPANFVLLFFNLKNTFTEDMFSSKL